MREVSIDVENYALSGDKRAVCRYRFMLRSIGSL